MEKNLEGKVVDRFNFNVNINHTYELIKTLRQGAQHSSKISAGFINKYGSFEQTCDYHLK